VHSKAISDAVWRLLLGLSGLESMQSGYLAGGTGLAMQLGHRVSEDLDFFFSEQPDYHDVLTELSTMSVNAIVMSQTPGHCELMINRIKVDLIRERIPLRFFRKTFVVEHMKLRLADPRDIGRQKLFAIGSRGSKKDFMDLYCLTRSVLPLEDLLALVVEEQGTVRFNRLLFLKGLIDFEEADRDPPPVLLWDLSWERVKSDLTAEVKRLAMKWS